MLFAALIVSLLFYIVIPTIGALTTRSAWRRFRRRIIDSSLLPLLSYQQLFPRQAGIVGDFRFFGRIEAIQSDNMLWITNGSLSIPLALGNQRVYFFGEEYADRQKAGASSRSSPILIGWHSVSTLSTGTQLFVSGSVCCHKGRMMFRAREGSDLLVIFYHGDERGFIRQVIRNGRQKNEYWNQVTPFSLIAGLLILSVLAYSSSLTHSSPATTLLALSLALIPILPLVLPGILCFFLYRRTWNIGRRHREARDLIRLPLRYFQRAIDSETLLPDGERYCRYLVDAKEALALEISGVRREGSHYTQKESQFLLFGALPKESPIESASDGDQLIEPRDPMAALILCPSNPEKIAARCHRQALLQVAEAIIFFIAGLAINFYLAILLLSRIDL